MVIPPDLIAGVFSFLFTLLIFSYLIGDNPLFRIAVYIFVGVSSGYIAAVAWWQVIWPRLFYPLMFGDSSLAEKGLLLVPPLIGVVVDLDENISTPRWHGTDRNGISGGCGRGGDHRRCVGRHTPSANEWNDQCV